MELYFYPRVVGTTNSGLISGESGYRWSSRRPPGSWGLRGILTPDESGFSIDELTKLEQSTIETSPGRKWVKTIPNVTDDMLPPWKYLLPAREYLSYVKSLVEKTESFLSTCDQEYYTSCWVPHRKIFSSISRMAAPDPLMFQDPDGFDTSSFKPRGGFCDKIVYDRFGTRTGRLTVTSGPSILTLRKDLRKFLRSRHGGNGTLLQVDFSALEVRLLAADPDKVAPPGDPYQSLADDLGLTRAAAKQALISVTYGSSDWGVATNLDVGIDEARKIVSHIHKKHSVSQQVSRLRDEFNKTGFIRNRYGRRVEVPDPGDGPLLNSYLQSTGVDVALWGFMQVIDRLPEDHGVPVALIHDAMILDVTNELAQKIGGTLNVQVPGYDGKFPLKVESIC